MKVSISSKIVEGPLGWRKFIYKKSKSILKVKWCRRSARFIL